MVAIGSRIVDDSQVPSVLCAHAPTDDQVMRRCLQQQLLFHRLLKVNWEETSSS